MLQKRESPATGRGYQMDDWKKTQYRIDPEPDYLAEGEDWSVMAKVIGLVVLAAGTIGAGIYWLAGLAGLL
jgi:hypothetical protein